MLSYRSAQDLGLANNTDKDELRVGGQVLTQDKKHLRNQNSARSAELPISRICVYNRIDTRHNATRFA